MKTAHQPDQATLDIVNELLSKPGISAMGGYAVGLICALAWNDGVEPPRTVLEGAASAESVGWAVEAWELWKRLRS